MREYLHGKIHKATITEANLEYVGSITIDQELMDKVDIHAGEKVLISDLTNGARLETYVIAGKKGEICMNGSTAHLMHPGDQIIIMGFEFSEKPISPKIILVDNKNNFIQYL